MIEVQIIQLIKDLSIPAVIALFLLILQRAGFWNLLSEFLRGKINGSVDPTVSEKLDKIESNDLHEVDRRLGLLEASDLRIEERLNKMGEDVSWLKAKINNK